jgi:hypothetical protein
MVFGKAAQDTEGDNLSWAPGSGINNNIIRFSDVLLLMAAEAEAQAAPANLPRSLELVNMVRNRAANPAGFVYHTYKDPSKPTAGFTTMYRLLIIRSALILPVLSVVRKQP